MAVDEILAGLQFEDDLVFHREVGIEGSHEVVMVMDLNLPFLYHLEPLPLQF